MLFTELAFFVFFPAVVAAHFLTPHRYRWLVLLAASYLFYGWWKPRYLVLLIASTAVDYAVGLALARETRPGRRRALLAASLAANLGLLFTFKYLRFFGHAAEWLAGRAGMPLHLPLPDLVLPLGISFYTFQTVSYVIDVYRREREPERHFGRFALFVAFFPHLVAGPIVRAAKLLPQLGARQRWDFDRAVDGLGSMLWGLFKKVVIADRAALFVDAVYDHPGRFQGGTVLIATYAFAFQIYCDFSGYSDIAVGAARVLGIELTQNFDRPYAATSIVDFWRRWHISLSTWFRDYLYLPLELRARGDGGRRVGLARRGAHLGIVFLLSGLWHGANWTFVAWGAFHGALMMAALWIDAAWRRSSGALDSAEARVRPVLGAAARVLGAVLTFHLVCLGWVLFRARSLAGAWAVLARLPVDDLTTVWHELCSIGPAPPDALAVDLAVLAASIALLEVVSWHKSRPAEQRLPVAARWLAWSALGAWVLLTARQSHTPFLYFQF